MAEGELAKVRSRGQMTVQRAVREEAGIHAGDYVIVRVLDDTVVMRKADLSGPATTKALLDDLVRKIGRAAEEKYGITEEEQLDAFIEEVKEQAYREHYGGTNVPHAPTSDGRGQ